jgi:hypothetical protein
MTPSQNAAGVVTLVESAVQGFFARVAQTRIASLFGLRCHTRVSELISSVVRGDKDSYCQALTAERLLLIAATDESVGQALRAALAPTPTTHGLRRDLADLIAEAGRTVTLIAQHDATTLSREARTALSAELTALTTEIEAVRQDLAITDRIERSRS